MREARDQKPEARAPRPSTPDPRPSVDLDGCLRLAAIETIRRNEVGILAAFTANMAPEAARAEIGLWLQDPAARLAYRDYLQEIFFREMSRLGFGAADLHALSAPADPHPEFAVSSSWGAPYVEWLKRLATLCADSSLSDAELLDGLDKRCDSIPGLIEEMDCDALADTIEAGMGAAAIAGAFAALADTIEAGMGADGVEAPAVVVAPLLDAVRKLDQRTPIAAKLSSAEWRAVPVALRERAQFSAYVASVRFLSESQDKLRKSLALERERVANGEAFVDRGSFIADMRQIAIDEGIDTTSDGRSGERGSMRDIRSAKRLGLIYDFQMQSAQEFARFKMGQDPDVLNEFPAWRFVRISDVKEPRAEHAPYEGQVRLKTDLDFWIRINQDFGVPWGPWGFGCGHDVEDVDRTEAESLGLLAADTVLQPAERDLNDKLQASVRGVPGELVQVLKDHFKSQIELDGDTLVWKPGQGAVIE